MDALETPLAFLAEHVVAVVFCAFMIEATGIPFPSRLLLVVAATSEFELRGLAELVLAATAGAVIGDHALYLGGMAGGQRLLALYCRITLGSERCVERTVAYFRRFGAAAVLFSRFSAGVRLFASVLSGCGHIPYSRFLAYELAGTIAYVMLWTAVGRIIGEHAGDLLTRHGPGRLIVLIGPVALLSVLAYRLWRRRRYGAARRPDALAVPLPAECPPETRGARSA